MIVLNKKIGLGTWSWGNKFFWDYKISSDHELYETFSEALNQGFSFIDTADSYGTGNLSGRSEELIGQFLQRVNKAKKNNIKIATKLAPYPWRLGRKGFSIPYKQSLNRLKNKLDIVQLHWSTEKYNPWQDFQLLSNLCDLIDEGFQFEIGVSNIGPKRLIKIINFLKEKNKRVNSVQVQFSLLSPNNEKQKYVKKICEQNNIDFLAYSPLAFGILCQDPSRNDLGKRSFLRNLIFQTYRKPTLELRYIIKEIAEARSASLAQVALNWCLYQGAIPIVGLRKKNQVLDICKVFKWDLTNREFEKLDNASKNCLKKMPDNPFSSL
tara:strand:+ start:262 stop:1233 length:972 start_codon:yes stop_codon:yes gene_type:complete